MYSRCVKSYPGARTRLLCSSAVSKLSDRLNGCPPTQRSFKLPHAEAPAVGRFQGQSAAVPACAMASGRDGYAAGGWPGGLDPRQGLDEGGEEAEDYSDDDDDAEESGEDDSVDEEEDRDQREQQLDEALARLTAELQTDWEAFLSGGVDSYVQELQDSPPGTDVSAGIQAHARLCGVPAVDIAHMDGAAGAFRPGGLAEQLVRDGHVPVPGVGKPITNEMVDMLHPILSVLNLSHIYQASKRCRRLTLKECVAKFGASVHLHRYFCLRLMHSWQKKLLDPEYLDVVYESDYPPEVEWLDTVDSWLQHTRARHSSLMKQALKHALSCVRQCHQSSSGGEGSQLLELEDEVLLSVLGHLDSKSLASASMTCRGMEAMVRQDMQSSSVHGPLLDLVSFLEDEVNDDTRQELRSFVQGHSLDGSPIIPLGLERSGPQVVLGEGSAGGLGELLETMAEFLPPDYQERAMAIQRQFADRAKDSEAEPPSPLSSKLARFNGSEEVHEAYSAGVGHKPSPIEPGSLEAALRDAMCDITPLYGISVRGTAGNGSTSLAGDTLACMYMGGYKLRNPKLTSLGLKYEYPDLLWEQTSFRHQMGDLIGGGVLVDNANDTVWLSGNNGNAIKGFSIPPPGGGSLEAGEEGSSLRYFLHDKESCVGLHVEPGQMFSVSRSGRIAAWTLEEVPEPAGKNNIVVCSDSDDDAMDGGSDSDGDQSYKGEPPTRTHRVLLPDPVEAIGFAVVAPTGSGSHTMVGACNLIRKVAYGSVDPRDSSILMYDWETGRLKQQSLGHLDEIMDMAVAPLCCPLGPLLATASTDSTVKVWDLRCRLDVEAAVITLAHGDFTGCCCFTDSSSASILFTGCGEGVAAWDLRMSSARALYELSTGNSIPQSMAWHGGSSSLLVGVGVTGENRHGEVYADQYYPLAPVAPFGILPNADPNGGEPVLWWDKLAKHSPADFRTPWAVYSSALLRYTFNASATERQTPLTREPPFATDDMEFLM